MDRTTGADGVPSGADRSLLKYPDGPIVVLGASYAGGWQPGNIAGCMVITRGISGQRTVELRERFNSDVVAASPRAVILWGFINDLIRTPFADTESAMARIRDNYLQMIWSAREHGIEPIVATEVTLRRSDSWSETAASWLGSLRGKEGYQERINRRVLSTNQWLQDVAMREGLLVLDFQAALAEQGTGRRREFTADDGSHITPGGYAALTAYASPYLASHLSLTQGTR
jgi:lysophospholipase L1-like esterase